MEIEISDNISLDMDKIEQSLEKRTETLKPLSGDYCIYKVPPRLQEPNKEKFTPQIVSIGPYHHRLIELQLMEEHKCRYLHAFLQRINMSLREYTQGLKELEIRLRQTYEEIKGFSREEFIEIMAVDGAFLMEYLLSYYCGGWDRIFERRNLIVDLREELFLIENQLPFFYFEHLFQHLEESNTNENATLKEIVEYYIRHESFCWETPIGDNNNIIEDTEVHHLLHFLIDYLKQPKTIERSEFPMVATPTISELHQVGVKFKPSSTHYLSSIKFANGVLEIPKLRFKDCTEKIFINMQAFEHFHKLGSYIGNYILIMDVLINDVEDIKILRRSGIIDNWLEDNHATAAVLKDICKWTYINPYEFSYVGVMESLNAYYKRNRHKRRQYMWKKTLKQKYFSNPWTIISIMAASFLLILTVIQTVCSILQVV